MEKYFDELNDDLGPEDWEDIFDGPDDDFFQSLEEEEERKIEESNHHFEDFYGDAE